MPLNYYVVYRVGAGGEIAHLNNLVVRGAARPDGEDWYFYTSENSSIPVQKWRLDDLRDEGGAVVATKEGEAIRFTPVTVEDVRKAPDVYGLTKAEAAAVKRPSDVLLLLHDMVVPEYYAHTYGPQAERLESTGSGGEISLLIEEDYQTFHEGREAPEGAIHYWASREAYYQKSNGEWRELPASYEWEDSHPSLPESSYDLYTDPKTREFLPERAALHAAIIDRLFLGKKPTKNPVAVLTMGLPASGKSTLSGALLGRQEKDELGNLVALDPDRHREHLPEYSAAAQLKVRNGARIVHKEVTAINDKALEKATEDIPDKPGEHYNFLLDGVGSDEEWYKELITKLKRKGYRVQLLFAHVGDTPALSGIDRLKIRAEHRGLRTGRFVDPQRISTLHGKLPKVFNALAKLVDDAAVYDTSAGDTPVELYAHRGDVVSGDPDWYAGAA